LLHEQADRALFRWGTAYSVVMGPLAYLAGAGLAWASIPVAFACCAAIAI
jgi:hypothetical protein